MALNSVCLLPSSLVHRRQIARHLRIWVLLLVAIPVLIWSIYAAQAVLALAQRQQPHDLASLRRNYGELVASSAQLQQELRDARYLQDLLHPPSYTAVIYSLTQMLSPQLQITSASLQSAGVASRECQLTLAGNASSHTELSEFVDRLGEHPMFHDPAMSLAAAPPSRLPSADRRAGFRLVCRVSPSEHAP